MYVRCGVVLHLDSDLEKYTCRFAQFPFQGSSPQLGAAQLRKYTVVVPMRVSCVYLLVKGCAELWSLSIHRLAHAEA
jgi:hypothetical protein